MNGRRPIFRFRLDDNTGVPVYRQIMDQVRGAVALGALRPGDQLPTVRQLAVDLAINPNTVVRGYRELELGGLLESNQGTGTFIREQKIEGGKQERTRQLTQIVQECVARAGAAGFTVQELIEEMRGMAQDHSADGRAKSRSG
ncbi:MAG: GntR family transcriptional regulator [Candidatus Korobacteraceae bacterium]